MVKARCIHKFFLLAVLSTTHSLAAAQKTTEPLQALCNNHETTFGFDTSKFPTLQDVDLTADGQNNMMRLPYILLLGSVHSLGPNMIKNLFGSYSRVIGAADNFRPPQAGLGLFDFDAVYIGISKEQRPTPVETLFSNASKWSRDGVSGWTWIVRDEQEGDLRFFASGRANGTLLLSNSEAELLRTARLLETSAQACSRDDETLSASPYWLKRESRIRHGFDPMKTAFAPDASIDNVTLSIDNAREAEIVIHGKFGPNPKAHVQTAGGTFTFVPPQSYVWHIAPKEGEATPNLWFGMLAMFGFEMYL